MAQVTPGGAAGFCSGHFAFFARSNSLHFLPALLDSITPDSVAATSPRRPLLWLLLGLARPDIRQRVGPGGAMLLVLVGLMLVANAFVTGNLANVLPRLQVRLAWVLPFAVLLLLAQHGPALLLAGLRRLRAAPR